MVHAPFFDWLDNAEIGFRAATLAAEGLGAGFRVAQAAKLQAGRNCDRVGVWFRKTLSVRFGVNRVMLTCADHVRSTPITRPVYPDKQTISEPVGTSHLCEKRTSLALSLGGCRGVWRSHTYASWRVSACSSQKRMSISRYMVVAMARCSRACSSLSVR